MCVRACVRACVRVVCVIYTCMYREFSDPAQVQDIIDKWDAHEANLADEDELQVHAAIA